MNGKGVGGWKNVPHGVHGGERWHLQPILPTESDFNNKLLYINVCITHTHTHTGKHEHIYQYQQSILKYL